VVACFIIWPVFSRAIVTGIKGKIVFAKDSKSIVREFGSIIIEEAWVHSTIIVFIVFYLCCGSIESSHY
jgi:hypothetical protein